MKFSYLTLNQEHQKLTGVLSAEDEREAREKLHAMGLSVISLDVAPDDAETTEVEKKEDVSSFAFHVIDPRGNETYGTIDAKDRLNAYIRLVSEYGFEVMSLCDTMFPEAEWEAEGKKSLDELAFRAEEEFGVVAKTAISAMQDDSTKKSAAFIESKRKLVEYVEEIVEKAELIIEKYNDRFESDEFRNIKNKIDDLMRLRLSNNLKYIQELADDLLVVVEEMIVKYDIPKEEASDILDEAKEKEKVEVQSTQGHISLSRFKFISKKLTELLHFKQPKKFVPKKKKTKAEEKEMHQRKQLSRRQRFTMAIRETIRTSARVVASKNSTLRKAYFKQLKAALGELKDVLTSNPNETELVEDERINQQIIFQRSFIYHVFDDLHLFFGWLLSFYIIYFYLATIVITKFRSDSPVVDYLQRSATSTFPFLITGTIFFLFLGLTANLRLSNGRLSLITLYSTTSVVLIAVFFVNFISG